jgi:predicted DNA-binding antitoxin AbrB/MazE fold protein
MSTKTEWINNCAQINLSKNNTLYFKVNKDIVLKEGDTLRMVKNTEEIDNKVKRGWISEEEAEQQKEKLSFVKYVLHKGPQGS